MNAPGSGPAITTIARCSIRVRLCVYRFGRECRMRAEFWVKHADIGEDDLRDRLSRVFGEDDRSAIDSSEVFTPEWRDSVLFAREDPSYRLICFKSTDIELQMHVEPIN